MKTKRGFTLVEMMLVVAIVVILATVGIIAIGDTLKNQKEKQEKYQNHIDFMNEAQSRVHGYIGGAPVAKTPTGAPATPTSDGGGAGGAGGPATTAPTATTEPTPTTGGGGGGGGAGIITGTPTTEPTPTEEVTPTPTEEATPTPDETTPTPDGPKPTNAAGSKTTITNSNSWENGGKKHIQGNVEMEFPSGVSEVTLIINGDVNNLGYLDWRYKVENLPDGRVQITYTAGTGQEKQSKFTLPIEAVFDDTSTSSIPTDFIVIESYS